MAKSVVSMSGGGVSWDCVAAAANGKGGIHMSRTGSVYSACTQDDIDDQ